MTATLLASLFAVTAGSVSAAAAVFSVTSAGSIPTEGTSGAVVIAVTEPAADGWSTGLNTFTFTLTDSLNAGTGTVDWSGTPVISGAPGSLSGITVSRALNVVTASFTASNQVQIENFSITGLTITTDTAAAGALRLIVGGTFGTTGVGVAGTAPVPSGTGTASGILSADSPAGVGPHLVICDVGSFNFAVTDASNGNLSFAAPDAESRAVVASADLLCSAAADDQDVSLTTAATGNFHAADTVVTQSVAVAGLIGSPGTVVKTLFQDVDSPTPVLFPGENNQGAADTFLDESAAATLATNMVVTFTIDTAGVLFSGAPTANPSGTMGLNGGAVGVDAACNLSFDRTSCSVTVTNDSSATGGITLEGVSLDIAASVVQGTNIGLNVTTSPVIPIVVNGNTIARVGRVLVGVSAQPTIYINENDQQSGMIVLTETSAGVLTDTVGANYFGLCLTDSENTSFTRAPWAVVTAGDLKIRSGVVGATTVQGTIVPGTDNQCVSWIVFTDSTVASVVEIRGSDAANVVLPSGQTNGPRFSVQADAIPGNVLVRVLNGSQANVENGDDSTLALVTTVTNAIRAFRNQPVVAAVNQVVLPPGTTNGVLGNITITETQAGQFKATDSCEVTILVSSQPAGDNQVVRFVGGLTANVPIVTTNGASGLLVGGVTDFEANDADFTFAVTQQAVGSLGVITISNMHVSVLGDAAATIVQVRVECDGPGVQINQVVSPARVGNPVAGTAATRLGVTQVGAFTTSTKVQTTGKYVTYRLDFGVGAAGQAVQIWGATKTGNDWSGFALVTTRTANASGVVYYYIRQNAATWKSYRGKWVGAGSFTPARQARWVAP
jgi:hypothetical protein